jgi:hypothetical protein
MKSLLSYIKNFFKNEQTVPLQYRSSDTERILMKSYIVRKILERSTIDAEIQTIRYKYFGFHTPNDSSDAGIRTAPYFSEINELRRRSHKVSLEIKSKIMDFHANYDEKTSVDIGKYTDDSDSGSLELETLIEDYLKELESKISQ